ncbi:isochorismatase family protein [Rheinheimera sp.]|uniref:isochorismatase family protein n=1 Tax=Rheinheimera sp. TaxID=1869214 RepID=UPI00307E1B41
MDLQRNSIGLGQRPALILVDMINGFTDPSCPLGAECEAVVAHNKLLLDAFRLAGLPVIFTTVVYHGPAQASVFRARIQALNLLTPDSHWVKVDSRLEPQLGEMLLEKRWASAFFGTDLAQQLLALKADSLVVTGLTTSGCVRATVVDGLQHNYPVVVAEEAVGDRNPDAHKANLHDMHAKYADVQSCSQIISTLLSTSQQRSA